MKHPIGRGGQVILAGRLTVLLVGSFLIPVPPLKDTFPPHELEDDDSEFIEIAGLDFHFF